MSNVGESYQFRLAKERKELLDKFIPAKRALQEKLRQQQDLKTEFSTSAKELFEPITTATKEVVTAIEQSRPVVPPLPLTKKTYDEKVQSQRNRFDDLLFTKIDKYDINDKNDRKELGIFIADEFSNRRQYLVPGQKDSYIGSFDKWVDVVYRIKKNVSEIDRDGDDKYAEVGYFAKMRDSGNKLKAKQLREQLKEQQRRRTPQKSKKQQEDPIIEDPGIEEPGASGDGYHGSNFSNVCEKNILDDVSRLEVLIGGRRAGNNSPEIINEATGICQRLLQSRIIDTNIYRKLVNEIIDDYYSD